MANTYIIIYRSHHVSRPTRPQGQLTERDMTAEMVKYASLKKQMKEFGIWWVSIPNFGNGDFSNF